MLNHLIGSRREPDRAITAALLPLRLFIGATFVYAGLDKLTDPTFFDHNAPTYIGQQMAGYVHTGSSALSLDTYVFATVREARKGRPEPDVRLQRAGLAGGRLLPRRSFLNGIGAVITLLVSGGLIGGIARLLTPTRGEGDSTAPRTAGGAVNAGSGRKSRPAGGVLIGSVKTLPINRARPFTDPHTGDPAVLIHLSSGRFVAYSAVCTHAGCIVAYDSARAELVCPCHGPVYDPRRGARVVAGPAPRPLSAVPVQVDAQGKAYAVDTARVDRPAQ